MTHSMPLPGPSSPHVRTRGVGSFVGATGAGMVAPCGMVTTRDGCTSYTDSRRCRAIDVIVTEVDDSLTTASSTRFWWAVGCSGTVWRVTIVGTVSLRITSSTSSPSAPP